MNTYKAYNKKGRSKQIIALMLVLVLSLGQMAIAMANTGSVFDPATGEVTGGSGGDGAGAVVATNTEAASQEGAQGSGEGGFIFDPNANQVTQEGDGGAADSLSEYLSAGATEGGTLNAGTFNDGTTPIPGTPPGVTAILSIKTENSVHLPGGPGVTHRQEVNISITILDAGVQGEPGTSPVPVLRDGMSLTITFPEYLDTNNDELDDWLEDMLRSGAIKNTSGIQDGNKLVLYFTDEPALNMGATMGLLVDVTKYDGEDEKITFQFDDGKGNIYWTDAQQPGISVNPGVPSEPGIEKAPFGLNFVYIGNGVYKIMNPDIPVEYRVGMFMPALETGDYIEIVDEMSDALWFCDVNGNLVTEDTIRNAFVFDTAPTNPMTITMEHDAAAGKLRFKIRIDGPMDAQQVIFRYYAKLVNAKAGAIKNRIEMTVYVDGEPTEYYDEATIIGGSSNALLIDKKIVEGTELVTEHAIPETVPGAPQDVTFVALLQQFAEGFFLPNGQHMTTDVLQEYFTLTRLQSADRISSNGAHHFVLSGNSANPDGSQNYRNIDILKDGDGNTPDGTYQLPFTVSVDPDKLQPGQRGKNDLFGNTVYVYRNAWLEVLKHWQPGETGNPVRGNTIQFELRYNDKAIARSQTVVSTADNVTEGGSAVPNQTRAVVFLNYLDVKHFGDMSKDVDTVQLYLHEILEPNSDYEIARPIPVMLRIDRVNGSIAFEASTREEGNVVINNVAQPGIASTEMTNIPDTFKGWLQFTKVDAGDKNRTIKGGKFELRQMTDLVNNEDFKNVDGGKGRLVTLDLIQEGGGSYYKPGANVNSFGIDNGKTVTFKELVYGTYRVYELEPPEGGYLLNNPGYVEATINKGGSKYQTVTMKNTFFNTGKITVWKKDDTANRNPIAGVRFELQKAIGGNYMQVTDGAVESTEAKHTDAGGKVTYSGLTKGQYRIIETVPSGFAGYNTQYMINFYIDELGATNYLEAGISYNGTFISDSVIGKGNDGQTITPAPTELRAREIVLLWQNKRLYADLIIKKYDETTGKTTDTLAGAKFKLERADAAGNPLPGADAFVAEAVTTVDGKVTFQNLEYGSYCVTEIEPPAGYEIRSVGSGAYQSFALDESTLKSGGAGANLYFEYPWPNPQQKGKIEVIKTGENAAGNQVALAGAKFGLYTYNSQTQEYNLFMSRTTVVSGGKASVLFDGLLHGIYYIRETDAPAGYEIAPEFLNPDGSPKYVEVEVGKLVNGKRDYSLITYTYADPRIKKDIRLVKTLADSGSFGEGVEFTLTGKDFSGAAVQVVKTTGAGGVALFEDLPLSNAAGYTITETKQKPGYAVIDPITVIINKASPDVTEVEAAKTVNTPHNLVVQKYDANNGMKYLPGAEFIIEVSDKAGKVTGNYIKATLVNAATGEYKYEGTVNQATAKQSPFVTVGADGQFSITHIPAGWYNIYETKAPDTYALLKTAQKGEIDKDTVDAYWGVSNSTMKGRLRIIKTDGDGVRLKNIRFRVEGPNGYDQPFTTDGSGVIEITGLLVGQYTITEDPDTTPAHLLPDPNPRVVTIAGDGSKPTLDWVEATFVNNPRSGGVVINKTDTEGRKLQNALFALNLLKADGSIDNSFGTRFATSDPNGVAKFENLPYGFFVIEEMSVPYGMQRDPVKRYVSIEGAPAPANLPADAVIIVNPANYEWENTGLVGKLTIRKTDTISDQNLLEGAKFKLYYTDGTDTYAVKLTDLATTLGAGFYEYNGVDTDLTAGTEMITPAGGTIEIGNLPYGIYEIVETEAPDGHTLATEWNAKVYITDKQDDVTHTFKNPPIMGKLDVLKVDKTETASTGVDVPLMGAVVRLYEYNGSSLDPADYENGAAVKKGEVTTSYNGRGAITNIPMGEYVAIEEVAPIGYALGSDAERVKRFTLSSATPNLTMELKYENDKLEFALKIIKVDEKDGAPLAGAMFKVVDEHGWGREVGPTDGKGEILIDPLAAGEYKIIETVAPAGYKLDATPRKVILGDPNDAGAGVIDAKDPKLVVYTMEDEFILGKVQLTKLDENDKQLEGAEFELLDENDEVVKLRSTGEGTYDMVLPNTPALPGGPADVEKFTAGKVTISNLPAGKYTFHELKAPDGYAIVGNGLYAFEITEANHTLVEVEAQNLPQKATLALRKVDATNHNLSLPGAEFTLYKSTDGGKTYSDEIEAKTTNSAGVVSFTDLTEGYYQVKETGAPTGYKLGANPFNFQVDKDGKILITASGKELTKDGEVYTLTFVNYKLEHEFRLKKVDSNTKAALQGAVFTITGNGTAETLTAGADGHTPYVKLNPGTYKITEIKAPDGYQMLTADIEVIVTATGVSVDGTALAGNSPYTYTVENTPRINRILLYKTDSSTGNPLYGATFSVTPRSGGGSITLTTNSSGQSNVINVTPGIYDIVETAAPSGYTKPLSGWTFQVHNDGTVSVSGSGITASSNGGVIVLTIKNTATTTTPTPTPTPGTTTYIPTGGGGGGSTSSSGGGSGSSNPSATNIPLGPGLPQTGQLTNTQAILLGASLLLLSLIALLLFVALGGKRENTEILPALM